MDIKYLYYFTKIAECGNYATVARKSYISQPGLYKAMRSLEAEIGAPLLEQKDRRIIMTSAGKILYPHAKTICQHYEAMMSSIQSHTESIHKIIRFGFCSPAIPQSLITFILDFIRINQCSNITMLPHTDEQCRKLLLADQLDFAIFLSQPNDDLKNFSFYNLGNNIWGLLISSDDPLAHRDNITAQELAGYTVIMPTYHNLWTKCIHDIFDNSGLSAQEMPTYLTLPDNLWSKYAHRKGTVFFGSKNKWHMMDSDSLRYVPFMNDFLSFSLLLVRRKGKHMSEAEKKFWTAAQKLDGIDSIELDTNIKNRFTNYDD